MKYNNEQVFFEIPSISNQWIFSAVICFDEMHNSFFIHEDKVPNKGMYLGKVTIFHSIIGDIHKFDITCRDFTTKDYVFIDIINPIFKNYCSREHIFLNFDSLNYE